MSTHEKLLWAQMNAQFETHPAKDILNEVVREVFTEGWCAENIALGFDPDGHDMAEDATSGGNGVGTAFAAALPKVIELVPTAAEFDSRWGNGLRDTRRFKATLFELMVLGHLVEHGWEVISINHKVRRSRDVEALVHRGGVEVLVECKLLSESDYSRRIEPFAMFGMPAGYDIKLHFTHRPSQEQLADLGRRLHRRSSGPMPAYFIHEVAEVVMDLSDSCRVETSMSWDDSDRVKATIRNALTKTKNARRKMWLFIGGQADARQPCIHSALEDKAEEERVTRRLHALDFVALPDSMEWRYATVGRMWPAP